MKPGSERITSDKHNGGQLLCSRELLAWFWHSGDEVSLIPWEFPQPNGRFPSHEWNILCLREYHIISGTSPYYILELFLCCYLEGRCYPNLISRQRIRHFLEKQKGKYITRLHLNERWREKEMENKGIERIPFPNGWGTEAQLGYRGTAWMKHSPGVQHAVPMRTL